MSQERYDRLAQIAESARRRASLPAEPESMPTELLGVLTPSEDAHIPPAPVSPDESRLRFELDKLREDVDQALREYPEFVPLLAKIKALQTGQRHLNEGTVIALLLSATSLLLSAAQTFGWR